MPKRKKTFDEALDELEFEGIRKMLAGLGMMGKPSLLAYRGADLGDGLGPGYWLHNIKPEMTEDPGLEDIFRSMKLFTSLTFTAVCVLVPRDARDLDSWKIIGPQPPAWTKMQEWLLSIGLTKIWEEEDAYCLGFDYRRFPASDPVDSATVPWRSGYVAARSFGFWVWASTAV